ncbi:hypothetical protein JW977_04480, partial [Candidatus Falkowbacteria bacterium]|nr:hypothetical protein [Candidatus Falkowbacteria bacterium]
NKFMNLEQKKSYYTGETVPLEAPEKTQQFIEHAQRGLEKNETDMENWDISRLKKYITFCEKIIDKYPALKDSYSDSIIRASEKILKGNDKDIESVMVYASDKIKDLRSEKMPNKKDIEKFQNLLRAAQNAEEESKLAA